MGNLYSSSAHTWLVSKVEATQEQAESYYNFM